MTHDAVTFTPYQLRALDASRHIAVAANAGSGKTRVLVERYVRILMSGVPVGEVVALTYTEKAASELKRKIADRVSESLLLARDPGVIARCESGRDALATAFVGTIHAFCARLLREFPVEAEVDAAFTVIERVDAVVMLRECVAEVLRDVLRGACGGISHDTLMDLLRSMGKRRVLSALLKLVAKRDLLDRLCSPGGVYGRPDAEILAFWDASIAGAVERELSSPALLSDLDAVASAASGQRRQDAVVLLEAIRVGGDLRSRAAAFAAFTELMLTKEGEIRKRMITGSASEHLAPAAARIREQRRLLEPLCRAVLAGTASVPHRVLLDDVRVLLAVATGVVERYGRRKEEEARLDFDDLQLKMRELLRIDSVRAELARRFRYVMVDEYQDTNTLQAEILLPLLSHLSSGNLFIVGDPKQSIYRFRDADVSVFEQSCNAIAGAAGDGSLVPLGESFRPLRDIVAFVNLVFSRIMRTEAGSGGIRYDPLVRARNNDAPGRVEILLPVPPGEGGLLQEDLIARRILDLRRRKEQVFDREEHPRALAFGDIALLLRSRNRLEDFEQAFIRSGIPYVVSGGVGYFQTQDVYDLYNYLRFLLNTADDVALAAILRAPFFTVSDPELFRLAGTRKGRTLWGALSADEAVAREIPSLRHAAALLADDLAVGVRLPAAELLARIIRRTHFNAALSHTPRGPQERANVDKLLQMAREYEAQGFTGLYDFVGRLRRLIDEEEKEGQAAIESHTDAVRIMTVHAAKGLEFPVVIVPDLQKPFQFDEEPFVDASIGVALVPPGEDADPAPVALYLRELARRKTLDEEGRIFYVACTRTRDLLILSAGPVAHQKQASWFAWLKRSCEEDGQSLELESLRWTVVTPRYAAEEGRVDEAHPLIVPVIRTLPPVAAEEGDRETPPAAGRMLIDPVPSQSKGEIFSASKIRTYADCPSMYYFRYVLGLPSGGGPFAADEGEEMTDRDYPAELRGRVFHAVMERADRLSSASLDAEIRAALAREAPFDPGGYPSLVGAVAALVRGVLSSRAWEEIASGKEAKTEFSISAALGGDFITGTVDRLYVAPDGVLTVLDYKTDAVSADDLAQRAGTYWAQLRFYALMVQRLSGKPVVRARILFATHPEILLERVLSADELRREETAIMEIIRRIKGNEFPPPMTPCTGCPLLPGGCGNLLSAAASSSNL